MKNVVDKGRMSWYNNQADSESWGKQNRINEVRRAETGARSKSSEGFEKNIEKTFKK